MEITWLQPASQQPSPQQPSTPPADPPTHAPSPRRRRWPAFLIVGVAVAVLALIGSYALVNGGAAPAAGSNPAGVAAAGGPEEAEQNAPSSSGAGKQDFAAAIGAAKASVVRVFASTCRGTGVGSGFLISPDTVVASLSSVDQAVAVAIVDPDGKPVRGTVVGSDPSRGVALVQLGRPLPSEPLQVEAANLAKGQWVAPVGLSSRTREVTGAARQITADGISLKSHDHTLTGLARLPGSYDPGLLGSPVLSPAGRVIGAVFGVPQREERLVVSGAELDAGIHEAALNPVAPAACDRATGPHTETVIHGVSDNEVGRALRGYFSGINEGDYGQAFDHLGPAFQRNSTVDDYIRGWESSYDFNVTVRSSLGSGNNTTAWVTFDSIFANGRGPDGATTCARWSIDYTFAADGEELLINGTDKHGADAVVYTPC